MPSNLQADALVGIVANPASARDIRRLIASASGMQLADRANIVQRALAGLGAAGVKRIAMMPDGPPSWFRWRGMERRITASAGPERIAAEWWTRSAGVTRRPARGRKAFGESYARAYERFMLGRAATAPAGGRPRARSCEADDDEPAGETRDYFKVQDEQGRWLWIYRVLEQGCWFVHGLWA